MVAACKADTGSCVKVTVVRPAKVVVVPPKEILVDPMVTDELVRLELPMLVSVLVDPLIDLFVRVCEPVKVATVESIATVTEPEPL